MIVTARLLLTLDAALNVFLLLLFSFCLKCDFLQMSDERKPQMSFSFFKTQTVFAHHVICALFLSEAFSCMDLLSDPHSNFRYFHLFYCFGSRFVGAFLGFDSPVESSLRQLQPCCSHSSLFFCFFFSNCSGCFLSRSVIWLCSWALVACAAVLCFSTVSWILLDEEFKNLSRRSSFGQP